MKAPVCPVHRKTMKKVTGKWGPYFQCGYGCDRAAKISRDGTVGEVSDGPTRQARMAAHRAFDVLWKTGMMKRPDAYAWLAGELGTEKHLTHIGMFSVEQCHQVVKVVAAKLPGLVKTLINPV